MNAAATGKGGNLGRHGEPDRRRYCRQAAVMINNVWDIKNIT